MAEMIKIYEENPNSNDIKKVVSVLRKGGLIIYPSDTVYALGCDISNYKALEKLARIKEIKLEKANFSFVCDSISNISDYVNHISTPTFKILKRSLPGPYTFILKGNNNLPKAFKKKKEVGIKKAMKRVYTFHRLGVRFFFLKNLIKEAIPSRTAWFEEV